MGGSVLVGGVLFFSAGERTRGISAPVQGESWPALSREMAASWPSIQHPSGSLPDYLDGTSGGSRGKGTRYGDAVMGYALLQVGIRDRDGELTRSGLDALNHATSGARPQTEPSVFETLGVAAAYNLARAHASDHPRFRRDRWATWLKGARTVRLHQSERYGNHWLVDGLAVLELLRTGLRSRQPGTVLGDGRAAARAQTVALVNRRVPAMARGRAPFVLSDPPDYELPYHGLSFGLYARLVRMLGSRASTSAHATLRQIGEASRLSVTPDGDVGYFGRSQGLSFGQSATAYGATALGRDFGGLADLAVARLRDGYGIGPRGEYIVPALRQGVEHGARALDSWAGAPSMSGIALVMLNWAIDERGGEPAATHEAPDPFAAALSRQTGRFAVARAGGVWYAVKGHTSGNPVHSGDLRYDFGLVAMKRLVGGRWWDGMPLRPRTAKGTRASAGPILQLGESGFPAGTLLSRPDGTIAVRGGFRSESGLLMRRTTFLYEPVVCGVRLSFEARAGDRYELSAFFSSRPTVERTTIRAAGQSATTSIPGRVRLEGGHASSSHADVTRARIVLRTPRRQPLSLTICG